MDGQDDGENVFYLHEEFPGAENLKPGQTITLKVLENEEGAIKVQYTPAPAKPEEDEGDLATGLREAMSSPPEQSTNEGY
jgi:hypothetical protein